MAVTADPFSIAADLLDGAGGTVRGPWREVARPEQRPPAGEWMFWYIRGGRGSGKTRTAAETFWEHMDEDPGDYGVVAPTFGEARDICIEGKGSGLLEVLGGEHGPNVRKWNRSIGELYLTNGSLVRITGADEGAPRIQGKNLKGCWCDEVGLWRRKAKSRANTRGREVMEPWEQAWKESIKLAVRLGKARIICTGTPKRGHPMIKMLMADPLVKKTLLLTEQNRANLSPQWYAMITAEYEGTTLGRQELLGEVLEDVEGALWTLTLIQDNRKSEIEVGAIMSRIATGVDPSGGVTETGIVKAAKGDDGHYYVWTDQTSNGVPNTWAKASLTCHFSEPEGDLIVAEKNQGGAMVESTLRTITDLDLGEERVVDGKDVKIKMVTASKGKQARAEPISSLYEQGKVHHVGVFGKLEEEMTTWVPDTGQESPNRLDALVWALTELSQGRVNVTPPAPASMTRQSSFAGA